MHLPSPTRQSGFTLIEMLVIAPIVILAIGAFLTVIISMTGEVLASRGSNALAYNVQDAVSRIEQDVKLSTTFLAKNNIDLSSNGAQGYNNDAPALNEAEATTTNFTNIGGSSGTSLILSTLVTNGNPVSTTSGVVYLTNKPNACASTQVQENTPMTMNVVYFVKNDPANNDVSTLWRRTILPFNYNTGTSVSCSTPWQQPSCAPAYTAPFCKANDVKLVEGVPASGLSIQYFTNASATIPDSVSSTNASSDARNTALASMSTASISISASQQIAGRTVERAATIRVSRLETNASTIAATPVQSSISSPPGGLTTATNSGSQITASWTAPAGTPTSYTLQYSRKSDFSSPVTISNITSTSQTVSSLTGSTVYFFRVSATNSFGTTAYSSLVTGATSGGNNWSAYTTIANISDWNNDGKNDLLGYKSNGEVYLHLGNGDKTFGGMIYLSDIPTTINSFIGPGKLPSGSAPVLWYRDSSNNTGYVLRSDGAYGVSGSPTVSANASTPNWVTSLSVFAVPYFYTDGTVAIIERNSVLSIFSLAADGVATFKANYGSGWNGFAAGDSVTGAGRFNGDTIGDIITIDTPGNMTVYPGTGTGTTGTTFSGGTGWVNNRISGGWDLSGDIYPDLVRYYIPTNIFYLYPGNGSGWAAAVVIP